MLLDSTQLKRYIAFCRARCAPRLSDAASKRLANHYVHVRSSLNSSSSNSSNDSSANSAKSVGGSGPTSSVIPITVRQLEAIIRISEAMAKLTLCPVATEEHVSEAIRLFRVSTFAAATATGATGASLAQSLTPQALQEVQNAETLLKRRLPVGSLVNAKSLLAELERQGVSAFALRRAVEAMVQRRELEYRMQGRRLLRKQ